MSKKQTTQRPKFGDVVVLKMDPDQMPRMITGKTQRPGAKPQFALSNGMGQETWHFAIEIEPFRAENEKRKPGFRQ